LGIGADEGGKQWINICTKCVHSNMAKKYKAGTLSKFSIYYETKGIKQITQNTRLILHF
jgi:hypothetical protein